MVSDKKRTLRVTVSSGSSEPFYWNEFTFDEFMNIQDCIFCGHPLHKVKRFKWACPECGFAVEFVAPCFEQNIPPSVPALPVKG